MAIALAALGSNLGDRAATLQAAIEQLGRAPSLTVKAVSRWRETLPVGGPAGQLPFLNGAVLLETGLEPPALWQVFQQLEQQAQRRRDVVWGPRTLDIDLLLYDDLVLDTPELTIPHPRMMFRRFAIEPAAEVAPALVHPWLGWPLERIQEHLATAASYVALFAPPGYGCSATEIARQVQAATGAELVLDPSTAQPGRWSGLSVASCLAEIERQSAMVQDCDWNDALSDEDSLVVSDFWPGQANVEARAWLDPAQASAVCGAWEEAAADELCPKLVVWLTAGKVFPSRVARRDAAATQAAPENRPCEIPLNREQLSQWESSALDLLAAGCGGPWLLADLTNPAAAVTEIVAAIEAMR